jgi:hypothetical protein
MFFPLPDPKKNRMGIIESASRLFNLLASHNTTFTQYLKSGLPKSEIENLVEPLGITLPNEVITFYSHYNLPKGYQFNSDQPTFFGIFWLLSLEDAVEEYKFRRLHNFFKGRDNAWFPLLQEDANFYYLDVAQITENICPITEGSEYTVEPETMFTSLEAMFDTMYYWIHEGALQVVEGHIAGDYEGNRKHVAEIASRINSGVKHWESY